MPNVNSLSMKDLSPIEAVAQTIADAQKIIDDNKPKLDKLIVAARKDGYPWPRIQAAANLSRQGVQDAARRANNGDLPIPRQNI